MPALRRRPAAGLAAGVCAVVLTTVTLAPSATGDTAPSAGGETSPAALGTVAASGAARVIVRAADVAVAERAVEAVGGHVGRTLRIIDGVAATVGRADLARLSAQPGVLAVTPDGKLHVQSVPTGQQPTPHMTPPSVYGSEVKAGLAHGQGANGQGVTVALLDTGITSSPDLAGRIKTVAVNALGGTAPCENLSGEPTCRDNYGHGTFMAGIIAGNGASSGGAYSGIAPQAKLVSIKVGSADGSADVSNVLAGVQWAVSFRQRYGIKVLNLSLGTDSTQSWKVDPLNYAVEKAWDAGITVIVAASNRGPGAGTISKPADDPWVITVGAVDDLQTTQVSDDPAPDFSGRGPAPVGVAKPDLAAPGANIVSLRSAGSTIDRQFPQRIATAYHQGSGTSMSTAVVSGVAALVLSKRTAMTPNRLKYSLVHTTQPAANTDPNVVGSGVVNAYAALSAPPGVANGGLAHSSGLGGLDASRGGVIVQANDPLHTVIDGPLTIQLIAWNLYTFVGGDWTADGWWLSLWNLEPIYSTVWYGDLWNNMDTSGCSSDTNPDEGCTYGNGPRGHNWEGDEWYGSWN